MKFEDLSITEQRDWALGHLHTAHIVIAGLKNQLSVRKTASEKRSIEAIFNLTKAEAGFITVLYSARGGVVTYDYIRKAMPGCRAANFNMYARRARRALQDDGAIKNTRSLGYSMSPEAVITIDAMLNAEAA